jgi:hypothetical protein
MVVSDWFCGVGTVAAFFFGMFTGRNIGRSEFLEKGYDEGYKHGAITSMTEYSFEFLDFSSVEAEDVAGDAAGAALVNKYTAEKLLDDCTQGGWEVVSMVPFKGEKENQYLVLLKKTSH